MSFKSDGPKTRPDRVKPVPAPRSRSSSNASTSSFTSAVEDQDGLSHPPKPLRFSPGEETELVNQSNTLKKQANAEFSKKDYSSALSTYDKALAELPNYLDYELAVLQSNIAACHLQLQEWKEAIGAAEQGLEELEREMPMPKRKKTEHNAKSQDGITIESKEKQEDNKVVELPEENDEEANVEMLRKLDLSDQKKQDIHRIRTKLLLRRARAKVMICQETLSPAPKPASYLDPDSPMTTADSKEKEKAAPGSTWGNLSGALEDYTTLAQPGFFRTLPTSDQKTVLEALRTLPPKVEAAKKKEVDEMMGKLKDLGNGILKPFGLSTDMFKLVQDPNTGGWSMNFDGKSK